MPSLPIGIGPVSWSIEAAQDVTLVAADADYHVVTDSRDAQSAGGPQWLSGEINLTFSEAGPGVGQITVNAPPHPDYPATSDHQYVVGHGMYLHVGGDQIAVSVWIATDGAFFFRESGVAAGTDYGAGFAIADGDQLSFSFRFPITEAGPE